ncbi:CHAT domain-containing protein [Caballeronia sp. LZ035]|uniref:CHAT domain-containing protein n=1 Tax=Caballeronia sp. LZ035 TaxID=3038568 RepID=UPI002864108F|nr:CHAT domain-containing protein [Caballeronia sp. LZ035]MDR5760981.1 CHAT domain-containing protein [Caballeronia sp. LZ035]
MNQIVQALDPVPRFDRILVVTNRDVVPDLLDLFFAVLPVTDETPALLQKIFRAQRQRRSSTNAAEEDLKGVSEARPAPLLIIVDGTVNFEAGTTDSGLGVAASHFLNWLETAAPMIPVMVLSSTMIEKLELAVLSRRNVVLFSTRPDLAHDASSEFRDALENLVSGKRRVKRRITIDVGQDSATYRFKTEYGEFCTDAKPYINKQHIPFLIQSVGAFNPYRGGDLQPDWKSTLNLIGYQLFDVLINDSIGPHIAAMLKTMPPPAAKPMTDMQQVAVELRFEINGDHPDDTKLFVLPFELASPNLDSAETFLCTLVPMARRVRLAQIYRREPHKFYLQGRAPRVLFVRANAQGNVKFVYDTTGERTEEQYLAPLKNIDDELDLLKHIAKGSKYKLLKRPIVVGGPNARTGLELAKAIRHLLETGRFEILHFSGHSTRLEDGSTYLVLPGENKTAYTISATELGKWVQAGGCELVVLSSCRGASVQTAIQTIRGGAKAVLGFRWDVDAAGCKRFFDRFYEVYLRDIHSESHSIGEAYRDACQNAKAAFSGMPLWASAVAVENE